MSTSYTSPFTGQTISPSESSYVRLTISSDTTLQWPINGNNSNVAANIVEVISTTGETLGTANSIIFPPATQISVGQAVLVRNLGANLFLVKSNDSTLLGVAYPGQSIFFYVTNNSTIGGGWERVQFGVGTSIADAASLDGNGLQAIGTQLNTATSVSLISAPYVFGTIDRATLFVWTGGAGTLTLPSAADVGAGWFVIVKNDGTGIVNIALTGINTIDGNASGQLQITESFVVCSNGTNYYSYAYGQSANFFYTQLVKNVTGGTVTLTQSEATNSIQEYQGVLTSNCTVILPPTVQIYYLQNNTTGAYTLTFSTGSVGADTLVLPQGQTIIAICDGTNVNSAQTASISTFDSIKLGNGSAANPSLTFSSDTSTGLFLAASGQLGIAISGVQAGKLTSTGLSLTVGINGGAF